MPRGIGKLTSLQTLSMFVVDKDGSHGAAAADLSELGGLNRLRGELIIKNLGFVKNAGDKFKAANLKEKQHLQSLVLEWRGDMNSAGNEEEDDDEEKSLEDLKPHPNLTKLHVRGWRGKAKFPSWFSLLTNLVDIRIKGPSKFKHLPSFARLSHLQRLKISKLIELEYMEDNGHNGGQGDSEPFFPSLKLLHLKGCPNMKSWWRESPIEDDGDKDDDKDRTASTVAFPCLSTLCIKNCPLSSMPLYPSVDDELILMNTSSRPLKHTIQMSTTTTSTSSLLFKTSSTSSVPLSKLKSFEVENIEELDRDMLDECLKNMTSLKRWGIGSCSWLKSLSEFLQQMTGLTSLKIKDCKELDLEGMQWEPLKNLSHLVIDNIPQLESLPLWLQHLDQLKTLEIENCSGLKSLFPVFQHLISLEELSI
ncbi:putative disease resistance protein RGA4 [Hibiscus syriacus]|uniref:putative disease resistance protein RGA4 n=1 Tax=Hibiscus syriacus TaxID=106335 RepID=UPI001920CCFE|nr:putative disease resistance protein RGA4 [Hibiscus syriacus]